MLANSAPSIGLPGVWYLTRLSGFLVQSPVDNFSLTSPFYSSVTQHLVTFNKILFTKGGTQVQSAPYCRPGPPLDELHCSPDLLVDWGGYIGWSPFPLNTFGVLMSSLVFYDHLATLTLNCFDVVDWLLRGKSVPIICGLTWKISTKRLGKKLNKVVLLCTLAATSYK